MPLVLGACSSSSTSAPTTTRAAGHQGATSVCSLVTPVQIKRTLGKTVDAPRVTNSTRLTVCTYPSKESADTVIVGFKAKVTEADAGLEQARLGKLHGSLTDVSGTGFSAYFYTDSTAKPTINGLVTINGQTQVTVTSTSSVAQQETLTQEIFATLAAQATGATTSTTAAGATPTTTAS
ncbi:MAG TPA: hypothetical protein VII96_08955 [Acidimicrobiales bacterium]